VPYGSAYGIEQSAFAAVRQRPCCAQNARNVFVSYHRTPLLFVDFAISFAINGGGRTCVEVPVHYVVEVGLGSLQKPLIR
jgi:hypothetical protein